MRTTDATALVMVGLLLGATPSVVSAESGGERSGSDIEPIAGRDAQPPKSERLRFRGRGPTCMCVDGLSEEEIAAAERKRRQAAADRNDGSQSP